MNTPSLPPQTLRHKASTARPTMRLAYSILCGTLFWLVITALPVSAATVTVSNTNDSGPGSLRQLLADAAPGDTITFAPALSGATIALSHTLTMTKDIIMDGRMLPIPVTLSGQGQRRVAEVSAEATVTIAGITIADGHVAGTAYDLPMLRVGTGGGLLNDGHLALTEVTFKNNRAAGNRSRGSSGALYNSGVVTITESLFQANTASGGEGGAIENYGQMRITNSSFMSNTVFHNNGGRGGAIYNAATLTITNGTFSDNIAYSAYGPAYGGGIDNDGALWIYHSTFSRNQVTPYYGGSHSQGGGIANHGTLHLYNTIIANSVDTNDCTGIPITNINNLIEDGTCESAFYGDPGLGILADHGGGTLTYDLVHGSAAIDAGDSRFCPATDQRGVARPVDGDSNGSALCDIGAYEAPPGPPITATVPPLPTRTPTSTPSATWTPAPTATPRPTYTYTPTPTNTATATNSPIAPPTPSPTLTRTPTIKPTFDVRAYVRASTHTIQVGDTITVAVTIDNQSIGCDYPVYDLTLSQLNDTVFRFDSPAKVGPPVATQTVYTLTAIAPGTVALQASAYGERYCGDFWQWTYVTGATGPINVTGSLTATATPMVTPTATPPAAPRPGDGNGDQVVDRADISACVQEIFDGDGLFWQDAPTGSYPGTTGCDANQDTVIDAGDIVCTILLGFHDPDVCHPVTGQEGTQPTTAQLTLGNNAAAMVGQPFPIPVFLMTNRHAVAAAAFVLHFDPNRFTLDPTDRNGDQLADAVTFALPPLASQPFITMTQTAETLSIFLTDIAATPATFSDGALLTVTLTVKPLDSTPVMSTLGFATLTPPSLGSQSGQSLPVQVIGSTVQIAPAPQHLYLPLIQAP